MLCFYYTKNLYPSAVPTEKITVVHIITGLNHGGAEMMLLKLLKNTDRSKFEVVVVCLAQTGTLTGQIEALDIAVHSLAIKPTHPSPLKLFRLVQLIRRTRPSVVQTWMYHADFLGGIAARIASVEKIVWNIRNSGLDSEKTKRSVKLVVRLCSMLSHRLPDTIITNSTVAAANHIAKGYKKNLFRVIPNGFDTTVFKPDNTAREDIRSELGLSQDTKLIGLIARFNTQKNHRGFLEAATILDKKHTGHVYILAGRDITRDNTQLMNLIREFNLGESVRLLGVRNDMPKLTASLDICTSSSSFGEAFPNVIGEAMSSAVPVVATDVGDSAMIIGENGTVIPVDDAESLAAAWHDILSCTDEHVRALGQQARDRIINNFQINCIAQMYQDLYVDLTAH